MALPLVGVVIGWGLVASTIVGGIASLINLFTGNKGLNAAEIGFEVWQAVQAANTGNPMPPNTKQPAPDLGTSFSENAGNPWLWVGAGVALFAGALIVKQFRGAARDVGSGVRSTYDEVRDGVDEVGSDPNAARRRK
jgi:hypothetical protein